MLPIRRCAKTSTFIFQKAAVAGRFHLLFGYMVAPGFRGSRIGIMSNILSGTVMPLPALITALLPENHFPAQIQDCNWALNFILAYAADYGLNPKEFIVGGASAGGHLALLLGLARHQRAFWADALIKPLAILDFFSYTDLNHAMDDLQAIHSDKGIGLLKDAGAKLLGTPVEQSPDKLTMASPINYVHADNPPVLILGGGRDDLVPVVQGRRLHAALGAEGIRNQFIVLNNAGHDDPLYSTPEVKSRVLGFLSAIFAKSADDTIKIQHP
jgi:acetyl esterase/lipase